MARSSRVWWTWIWIARPARGIAAVAVCLWAAPAAAQTPASLPAASAADDGAANERAAEWPEPGRVELRYQLGKGTASCEREATFRAWVAGEMDSSDPFARKGPQP